ncbi:MAG: 3-hydroxyacyl-CoA dehydrogenase NAD-binding domain-containing protein, partial [Bdellovibrionaceae bacterium]|nr:3-hydroxyacyl-CoA dehydrogenase NAD-binding domain-containing protein [Pseudobdellovibrionaceae bacterium]
MQISIFGSGYVGLVTGVCFAEMGNDVICADIDSAKVAKLQDGISPIYEPGLDELIASNLKAKRIQFTTDLKKAVEESELLFIGVGTPSDVD